MSSPASSSRSSRFSTHTRSEHKYSRSEKRDLRAFSADMPKLAEDIADEVGVKLTFKIKDD